MHSDGSKDNPRCGFCGGIVPPNFWYCTHCGADLEPVDAPENDDSIQPSSGAWVPAQAPAPATDATT